MRRQGGRPRPRTSQCGIIADYVQEPPEDNAAAAAAAKVVSIGAAGVMGLREFLGSRSSLAPKVFTGGR